MRQSILVAMVAMATTLAVPGASAAQIPTQDSVSGSGNAGCGLLQISAQSGPSGENPSGQFSCEFLISGPVTCLNVQGNVALLTIQTQFGFLAALRATDNGPSGTDRVEAIPTGPRGCAEPEPSYENLGFTGDIVVIDAPPPPTSKDQCTSGGWQQFGFKNQGQCVRFVRKQARQACRGERAAIGREAFRAKYGTGKHHRHAMRGCVRQRING